MPCHHQEVDDAHPELGQELEPTSDSVCGPLAYLMNCIDTQPSNGDKGRKSQVSIDPVAIITQSCLLRAEEGVKTMAATQFQAGIQVNNAVLAATGLRAAVRMTTGYRERSQLMPTNSALMAGKPTKQMLLILSL